MTNHNLLTLPLHEVAELLERRDISPMTLTQLSVEAIEHTNPLLNAFRITLVDRALDAARRAEAEITEGHYRGPLHGIPLAIKDLMDIQGVTTPAGSKVLADRVAGEDSHVVRLLEEAGAIIVGKTSMPEFAFSPASNNPHYGPVPNPWNDHHDAGGSSSGSGAAVAAGLVFGATGSDTGGSIRMPSTLCGIVGLKPTFGRVSAHGAVTLSWSLDHIGPMTRTVRDAALLLNVMAGYDARDARTRRVPVENYAAGLEDGVAGVRVAVVTDDGLGLMGTPAVLGGLQQTVTALEGAGAEIIELALPELGDLATIYLVILLSEAAAYYEPYLREQPDAIGEFARDRLLAAWAYSPIAFVQAQQARAKLRHAIEDKLDGIDLVVLPGMPHEAPPLGVVQQNTRFTGPFNALGWPAIVVPTLLGENNLPVAVQIVGRPWLETLVLRAARVVERDGPWEGRMAEMPGQGVRDGDDPGRPG